MAKRSSTSSSERRAFTAPEPYRYDFEPRLPRRFPAAFAIAVAIVAAVEIAFRVAPADWVIPHHALEVEYFTSLDVIDAFGPADVSVVGSSRAKEGLAMPALLDSLHAHGVTATAANYACAGARADETRALVEHLLRRGRPRLLLYGITPRDLLGNDTRYARAAIFWSFEDWQAAFREHASAALRVLPVVVRGEISRYYVTLRYRQRPWALVEDVWRAVKLQRDGIARFTVLEVLRGDVSPNPARGEWTRAQAYDTKRSLVTHPISDEHVRNYVNGLLINGEYPLGERRIRELRATISAAKRAGVPIVIFETPISERLMRFKPPGVYAQFLEIVREEAVAQGVPFRTASDLGVELSDADFIEQSHLNRRGAEKLTAALFERAILPALEGH